MKAERAIQKRQLAASDQEISNLTKIKAKISQESESNTLELSQLTKRIAELEDTFFETQKRANDK